MRTPHTRSLTPRQAGRRFVAAQRRQVALWELILSLPAGDATLHWVDTINGPRLLGFTLPTLTAPGAIEP
jgi:hypothetical protein